MEPELVLSFVRKSVLKDHFGIENHPQHPFSKELIVNRERKMQNLVTDALLQENPQNMRFPAISKLLRQDSVDDFLAGQRVPKDAIRQFIMADQILESERPVVVLEPINLDEQEKKFSCKEFANNYPSIIHLSELNNCKPSLPKLKRQDSVDDFLADESSRRRCLADFIQLDDDSKGCAAKVNSKSESTSSWKPVKAEPSEPTVINSIADASIRHVVEVSLPTTATTSSPPLPKAAKNTKKRHRSEAPVAEADGEEDRQERRREQNREAQRRFRERRKYREFQAFSGRLAAAAGFQTPPACTPGFSGLV
jgi:hypothetical protein